MSETKNGQGNTSSIEVTSTKRYSSLSELKAKTALDKAAPDMLATLEGVLIHLKRVQSENESIGRPFDEDNADAIGYVEQTIAKAKGD